MIENINPSNSEAILHIMSGVGVCLNTLLSSEAVSSLLKSDALKPHMCDKRIIINSKEALIYNIIEVLTDPRFAAFRHTLVNKLDVKERESFNKYHLKVLALASQGYAPIVPDVIESLMAFKENFITQLYILLENYKDEHVKNACIHLIETHLVNVSKERALKAHAGKHGAHHHPHHTEHDVDVQDEDENENQNRRASGYANIWGCHVYCEKNRDDLELINQRIRVNQILQTGISNKRGIFFKFKEGQRFNEAEVDRILMEMKARTGDYDIRLFGALNTVVTAMPALHDKLLRFT